MHLHVLYHSRSQTAVPVRSGPGYVWEMRQTLAASDYLRGSAYFPMQGELVTSSCGMHVRSGRGEQHHVEEESAAPPKKRCRRAG